MPESAATPQTAAAPSPFTPIANYGFLSNCHTGALVAPDGTVDWLCVPRFDSPSVFGALLDRGAGGFRFGPFGINVPSDRIYEPGTDTLVTSWKTPTGWVVVRDALTMGPRRGEDTVTPHTRPPSDEDADHALVRTAKCIDGSVEIDLVCEPGFDYGRLPGEWTLSPDRHRADAKGGERALRLQTDMLVGIEAGRARARHVLRAGEPSIAHWPGATRRSSRPPPTRPPSSSGRRHVSERLARAGRDSRPRVRADDPAVGAHDQGTHVHADGRGGSGAHDLAAGDARRRAELGLPLQLAPRPTFLLRALHYLLLDWEADEFMQYMADLERNDDGGLQIMYGIDGRRDLTESVREDLSGYDGAYPVRIGNGAFDQRQNDVFGAALDSVLLHSRRSQRIPRRLWPLVQAQAECATAVWRQPDRASGRRAASRSSTSRRS